MLSRREALIAGSALLLSGAASTAETPDQPRETNVSALMNIRQLDYTVIFARDMLKMRAFYEEVMGFPVLRTLNDSWIDFGVGSNRLALTVYGLMWNDEPPKEGALSLQLAFRVPPGDVEKCARALEAKSVRILSPVTDQPWGHRTVFFRDPDGNVLEIYADL